MRHNLTLACFRYKEYLWISNIVGSDLERTEDAFPAPDDDQDMIIVYQILEESMTALSDEHFVMYQEYLLRS